MLVVLLVFPVVGGAQWGSKGKHQAQERPAGEPEAGKYRNTGFT